MSSSKNADKHFADEVVEHIILEKTGALKGEHHFLPKSKPKSKSSDWLINTIGTIVIVAELWYMYVLLS